MEWVSNPHHKRFEPTPARGTLLPLLCALRRLELVLVQTTFAYWTDSVRLIDLFLKKPTFTNGMAWYVMVCYATLLYAMV